MTMATRMTGGLQGERAFARAWLRERKGRTSAWSLFLVILLLVAGGHPLPGWTAPKAPPTLRFGVLNQQSPIQTAKRWNPILRYLSGKTGIPLRLVMAPTVTQTDAMMARGEFDLLFSNHNFQPAHDGRYRVLARWAGPPIRGALVVPSASPAHSLEDLHDVEVTFPSPDALMAYAVPMLALRQAGVSVNPRFAGNQNGVLVQLKAGRARVAAVNTRFLDDFASREGLDHRIIYLSEPYQEIPVLVHPRVPPDQARALAQALLGMAGDPGASALLRETGCPGFVVATESDYDNVRAVYRALGK